MERKWMGAAMIGRRRLAPGRGAIDRAAVVVAGLVLLIRYAVVFQHDPARPGANPESPLGWWGWFDQSMTLRSMAALLGGNLDMSQHHYPLGYSLLAAAVDLVTPGDPYFTLDLACLLAALGGFVALGRRLGISPAIGAALFAAAALSAPILFRQWVLPWNTTPVAACLWLLLAAVAAWLDGVRRPVTVGVLMGLVAVCRPSDVVVLLPCVAAVIWAERRRTPGWAGAGVRLVLAGAAVVLPAVALHVAIYGWAQSPYMIDSARLGFTWHGFGWKSSVLLSDPYPWFAEGQGILQRSHWIALGVAALLPALARGAKERVLALTLLVHGAFYLSYVDLLPTGLWRFSNIHYFTWAIPGYALLASLLLRDLLWPKRAGARWTTLALAAVTAIALCWRSAPRPTDGAARAVDFAGPLPPYMDTMFFRPLVLRDGGGTLFKGVDFRAFLYPGGVRVIALRRELTGTVEWVPGYAPEGFEGAKPVARWRSAAVWQWPPAWWAAPRPPAIPMPGE